MNARDYALLQLDDRSLPGWPAQTARRRARESKPPADPRDLALAENITIGVLKNLLLLQHLMEHYSGRRLKQIDPAVQKVLAVGLYQLRFLQRIPPSAAVDEAVEQTRRFRLGRAGGFVNAVLRAATRQPEPPGLATAEQDPESYATVVLSHPPELYRRLRSLLGVEDAIRFCRHDNAEPPTIVRLCRGVQPSQLTAPGVSVRPHEQQDLFVIEPAKQPLLAQWAAEGLAQPQDPTAAMVVQQADLTSGQTVLDRCAGVGTKTLQLREWVGESGRVIALEPSATRCAMLRRAAEQRRFANIQAYESDRLQPLGDHLPKSFDRVLVDVPCSNSGVLARRPEARYGQLDRTLQSLCQLQMDILHDTAAWVAPGGLLVYSTCSVWPQENQQLVQAFLQSHPGFRRLAEQATLPSFDEDPLRYHDGGYYAVLQRTA